MKILKLEYDLGFEEYRSYLIVCDGSALYKEKRGDFSEPPMVASIGAQ